MLLLVSVLQQSEPVVHINISPLFFSCIGHYRVLSRFLLVVYFLKKNEIMSLAATHMDLEIVILNEINQTEKDKYHMISLLCEIQKMVKMLCFFLHSLGRSFIEQ